MCICGIYIYIYAHVGSSTQQRSTLFHLVMLSTNLNDSSGKYRKEQQDPWKYRWDGPEFYHSTNYSNGSRKYRKEQQYHLKNRRENNNLNNCDSLHHSNVPVPINRCYLNRAFRQPVLGPNGMIIYDLIIHEACVSVWVLPQKASVSRYLFW